VLTRVIRGKRPRRSTYLVIAGGLLAAAGLLAVTVFAVFLGDSGTVDVRVADRTTSQVDKQTAGGAFVSYFGDSDTSFGASGTGIFDPFVRIQGTPTEQGYNTNGTTEFDTKVGTWTHAIKVSQIPQRPCPTTTTTPPVTIGSETCFELFVDVNENNSTPFVSLNKVEVYFASGPGAATLTGYPFNTPPAGTTVTEQYSYNGQVLMKDVNQGSGRGDLRYDIPINKSGSGIDVASINCDYGNPLCNTYFVLYSQWGTTGTLSGTNYNSDGGFEEWQVRIYPVVHILKTANPAGPVNAGNPIGFDITVSNTSAIAATNVVISDPLPAGGDLNWSLSPAFTGCSITGSTGSQTLNCTFATLAANSSIGPIHITSATTKADCAVVTNTASFTTGNDGSGSSTASVTVQCGALVIKKESTKTGNPLVKNAGAVFSITGPGGYSTSVKDNNNPAGTATDEDSTIGQVCISGLAPGSYTVNETSPPTGYAGASQTNVGVTVTSGTNCSTNEPTATAAVFTNPPKADIQVNFRDGGSGETSATISCDNTTGTATSSPVPSGWTTTDTVTGISAPTTVHCTIVIDP